LVFVCHERVIWNQHTSAAQIAREFAVVGSILALVSNFASAKANTAWPGREEGTFPGSFFRFRVDESNSAVRSELQDGMEGIASGSLP
jgi:hypothetical protein